MPTHAELVRVAERWLRNTQRCGVVLTEHHGGTMEHPDAIGWRRAHSIQVECKVSVSDFRADAKKNGRRFDQTTGEYRQALERWYLTPAGLLALADVPPAWGLIEWDNKRVRVIRKAETCEKTPDVWRNEVTRMYCELRRYQAQGIKYLTVEKLHAAEKERRITERAMRLLSYHEAQS